MRTRFMLLCGFALAVASACAEEALVPNLDLSEGLKGWSAWTGATAHPWTLDPNGRGGKPALRIDAQDAAHNVMVMTHTGALKPGQRYALEAWWRLGDMNPGHQVDLRVIFRDAKGKWLTGEDLHSHATKTEKDWVLKRYRLIPPERTASTAVGVWVRETTGTIWVSDMSIRLLPPGERSFDSMYDYDPHQVQLGMAPLKSFYKLKESGSPFLAAAKRWNQLLVDAAFWQEDVSRARRAALYSGREESALAAHAKALAQALADLDRLQQTYGRLYAAGRHADLAATFDPAADKLAAFVTASHAAVKGLIAEWRPAAEGPWLTIPKAATDQPWWDAAKGQPRYMLWNRWSDARFRDLEEPLQMGDCQTLTAGAPSAFQNGVASWQSYLDQRPPLDEAGARRFSLITHYSLHDKGYLAREFVQQQGNDPDLRLWDQDGKPMGAESGVTEFNWLNPNVRRHMVDVLTQMAQFFKDKREYQFYVDSWECAGPYARGVRIGSNPSHRTAFRQYLQQRYGTIGKLNERWRTAHRSFDDLSPAPESPLALGAPGTPLYIESQRWAQEAYVDYLKLIRDTIARVDPTKPVLGEHSGLLATVLSPRIFESVDILGHHHRARTTMPVQVWMSSLQRYARKPTGLFENFWGCQEDHPRRMSDERAMRAQMRRYLYRHAAWGRCTQTWWYAYTSAPYLTSYNGNWFNPVYDLTTFRYCAAGFPVEKQKVDKLEALLLNSEIVPSRLLLVQPYAAMLVQGRSSATLSEWLGWHDLLFPRNLLYEALPDSWFAEGTAKLSDFEAVILPLALHLDRAFSRQLIAFLKEGGKVIASGPPGLYDELAQADGALLAAAQPPVAATQTSEPGKAWRFSFGAGQEGPGWTEANVGRGELVLLPQSVLTLSDRQRLADLVRGWVIPAAEAPNTALELLLRRLPDGRHLLCALNRDPDSATTGDVLVKGRFTRIADVDMDRPFLVRGHIEGDRTRFRVTLDPGSSAYFLLASGE